MADGPEIPDALRGAFDPQRLQRMQAVAETLVHGLLLRRREERPVATHQEVPFPQGTHDFRWLHEFTDDPQSLVTLLDWVAQRLTVNEDRRWRVAMADPATCSTIGDGTNQIMLYPGDIDVSNMIEVHPDIRIFRLLRRPPYAVMELAPFPPARIEQERGEPEDPLAMAMKRWSREHDARQRRLLRRLRAEFDRQRDTLDTELARAVVRLLHDAQQQFDVEAALQAASYLGIHREVTAGFDEPE